MRRIHPFVAGHVVAGLIVGAGVGVTLDAEAAVLGGALLAAGAAVSSLVCWWKPGLERRPGSSCRSRCSPIP